MFGLLKPDKKQVGNRIKIVKDELGASLTELGERLGLLKSTMNSYVQGYSLAPMEVVEQLSQISGKPVEWFYFGKIEDFIRDYLCLKGYAEVISDYPNIPEKLKADFLTMRNEGSLPRVNDSNYPNEDLLDLWFSETYSDVMEDYITKIASEFVENQAELDLEQKDILITFISREIYDCFDTVGIFEYGNRPAIEQYAKEIFEKNVKGNTISFSDQYLVGKLINILNSADETAELIRSLSMLLTQKGFSPMFGGEELITIFKSMRPALIKLYTGTTTDMFYDWFEK